MERPGSYTIKNLDASQGLLEFGKYFFASLTALALDVGLLLLLSGVMHYIVAATISFFMGSLLHYFLSIKLVFRHRKLIGQGLAESTLFLAAGGIGIIVNLAVIALCIEAFGTSLLVSKLVAAGFSFLTAYGTRKIVLF